MFNYTRIINISFCLGVYDELEDDCYVYEGHYGNGKESYKHEIRRWGLNSRIHTIEIKKPRMRISTSRCFRHIGVVALRWNPIWRACHVSFDGTRKIDVGEFEPELSRMNEDKLPPTCRVKNNQNCA